MNEGTPVDIIYLDYMKAFDKVSHRHLLHKLQNFGIHHHYTEVDPGFFE